MRVVLLGIKFKSNKDWLKLYRTRIVIDLNDCNDWTLVLISKK